MDARQLMSRREALVAMGAGVGAIYGLDSLWQALEAEGAGCLLQRQVTEGPYYLDLDLVRRNIRRGRKGTPLTLSFRVLNARTCRPIKNASVEIWHADASGVYSGVQGNTGNFLRGIQRSDANGKVRFETIFPGWYRGRTPHIHMKVFVGGDEVHTGQVFFQAATARAVYRQGVYASRGKQDTSNGADSIYRQAGSRAIVPLKRRGTSLRSGLAGTMAIGVRPS